MINSGIYENFQDCGLGFGKTKNERRVYGFSCSISSLEEGKMKFFNDIWKDILNPPQIIAGNGFSLNYRFFHPKRQNAINYILN